MIVETTRALIELLRNKIEANTVLSAGAITEISRLPVVVLSGPTLREKKRLMRDPARITKIEEEKAIREVPPRWYDLLFDVSLACESKIYQWSLIMRTM